MTSRVEPEMRALAEVLAAAATMLGGELAASGPARDLLLRLDYLDGATELAGHRAALLRAAAGFKRIFTLEAPDAPGLVALGAEVDAATLVGSVSGTGTTFRQAFESCVGEGVEYLSQFVTPDDPLRWLSDEAALAEATPGVRALWERLHPYRRADRTGGATWTVGADLAAGTAVPLPADLCFRRPDDVRDIDPPWPLSTGCGAGTDPLDATLHGLLELIERDAVALWWRGGCRARLVAGDAGTALLAQLRRGPTQRRTWLLDITSDTGVPSLVAASCHDDGFGLCCGYAARPTLAGAAEAAVMELAQMELAHHLTETKRAVRGDAALNDVDRRHISRFTEIDVARTPLLHPMAPPRPTSDLPSHDKRATLAALRQRLDAIGLAPCAVNLTRGRFGIPVTRAVCPGLEPGLTGPAGPRLCAAAALSGIAASAIIPL